MQFTAAVSSVDRPLKEWEMRRTTYRVSEAAYAIKRQKLMQESPGTKGDPIYLSMFDWC